MASFGRYFATVVHYVGQKSSAFKTEIVSTKGSKWVNIILKHFVMGATPERCSINIKAILTRGELPHYFSKVAAYLAQNLRWFNPIGDINQQPKLLAALTKCWTKRVNVETAANELHKIAMRECGGVFSLRAEPGSGNNQPNTEGNSTRLPVQSDDQRRSEGDGGGKMESGPEVLDGQEQPTK